MFKKIIFLLVLLFIQKVHANNVILVLGDSLSASYGIEYQNGWVELLKDKLKNEKIKYNIINSSISGETTAGGLKRLPRLLKENKPKVVILQLGANDGLRGLSIKQIYDNIKKMVALIKKNSSKCLLVGIKVPPNYGNRYSKSFFEVFTKISNQEKINLVPFLFKGFATNQEYFLSDGIHPNKKAQPIMLENIWLTLSKIIN